MFSFKQRTQTVIAGFMTVSLLMLPSGGVLAAEKAMKKKAPPKVVRPTPKKLKAPAKKPAAKKIEVKKKAKAPAKVAPKKAEEVPPPLPTLDEAIKQYPEELPPAGY